MFQHVSSLKQLFLQTLGFLTFEIILKSHAFSSIWYFQSLKFSDRNKIVIYIHTTILFPSFKFQSSEVKARFCTSTVLKNNLGQRFKINVMFTLNTLGITGGNQEYIGKCINDGSYLVKMCNDGKIYRKKQIIYNTSSTHLSVAWNSGRSPMWKYLQKQFQPLQYLLPQYCLHLAIL